ncbi:hypothetical protein CF326_g9903, partial [Tilletia indica]
MLRRISCSGRSASTSTSRTGPAKKARGVDS